MVEDELDDVDEVDAAVAADEPPEVSDDAVLGDDVDVLGESEVGGVSEEDEVERLSLR